MEFTLGKVLSWLVGLLLVPVGLIMLILSVTGGLILILVGAFALPPTRRILASKVNISFSRWLVAAIIVVGLFSGLIVTGMDLASDVAGDSPPSSSVGDRGSTEIAEDSSVGDQEPTETAKQTTVAPTPESSQNPDLITKQPEDMLPSIDEFESGWQQTEGEDSPANQTSFYNVDTDTVLVFNVKTHDTINGATTEYNQRRSDVRDEGMSSESVDVGDEGFLYKLDRGYIYVNFRIMNVVGRVQFDGPNVLTPESNAVNYAQLLRDNIVE